jgi:NAD(P)-dependent dehydrogenase (short-subunit alcohol dehydrogenase family)
VQRKENIMLELPLKIDFTGKTVVVTGAGGVLCGTMAKAFAQAGARVAALDLNEEAVKKLEEECANEGYTCKGYKANVLDLEELEAVHQQVSADLGPCDILINGAGGNNPRATTDNEYHHEKKEGQKTFFDLDPNGVDFVFKLNFQGTLLPTQVFAKEMADRKSGCILNVSSMNAYVPLTKIPAYSGAKAAVSNFTQWLATHFAGTGIRCNAIAPGFLVSNQNRALLFQEDGTPTPRSNKILAGTPMGRFVEGEELLGGVFFLCDDKAASAITGVVLPIDAGYSAYSGV